MRKTADLLYPTAGCREGFREFSIVVNRSLAACSAALALLVPVAAFAAPPGAFHPVYHPTPLSASHGRPGVQEPLKVPFNFSFHRQTQEFNPQSTFNPLRWRRYQWESLPPFLPLQSGCSANALASNGVLSSPWGPSGESGVAPAQPAEFTIGSLVDKRSQKLFSSPTSYAQDLAASNTGGPETSGPLTLQYGFTPAPCGAVDSFNFQ